MIEVLKPKQTLKAAELQDGDIVCFQRSLDLKGDRNYLEKRLGLNEKHSAEDLWVARSFNRLARYSLTETR